MDNENYYTLMGMLSTVLYKLDRLEKMMSSQGQGLTDLQTAVTALDTAVAAAVAEIQAELAAIQAANNASGDPDPAVETAAQNINAQITALNAAVAAAQTPAPAGAAQQAAAVKKSPTGL